MRQNNVMKRIIGKLKNPFRTKKDIERVSTKNIEKKSKTIKLETLETEHGNYDEWQNKFFRDDNQIGIILGARGTGKTALGFKLMEEFYYKTKKKCFVMGVDNKKLPFWIKSIDNISGIRDNSLVLIDEGGILFSSRRSMANVNKMLSQLILISRHKNINILFISQNSSNLEIDVLRQADFLLLKKSSLLQKDFERKIVQKIYSDISEKFREYLSNKENFYLYSEEFRGIIKNNLPTFWSNKISKNFKNYKSSSRGLG